jgi:hypothetical protein
MRIRNYEHNFIYFDLLLEIPHYVPINRDSIRNDISVLERREAEAIRPNESPLLPVSKQKEFVIPSASEEPSPALRDELTEGNLLLFYFDICLFFLTDKKRNDAFQTGIRFNNL